MIGVDTNVLLRYLTEDDPAQAATAAAIIDGGADRGESFFICGVVLCEVVWVLESAYRYGRERIAETIELLLSTGQFEIEGTDDVRAAHARYRAGRAGFADFMIGRANHAHGCDRTVTFDRALDGEAGFEVL